MYVQCWNCLQVTYSTCVLTPSCAVTLPLSQAALDAGNAAAAQALLGSLQDDVVARSGAVVATRVALYEQVGAGQSVTPWRCAEAVGVG